MPEPRAFFHIFAFYSVLFILCLCFSLVVTLLWQHGNWSFGSGRPFARWPQDPAAAKRSQGSRAIPSNRQQHKVLFSWFPWSPFPTSNSNWISHNHQLTLNFTQSPSLSSSRWTLVHSLPPPLNLPSPPPVSRTTWRRRASFSNKCWVRHAFPAYNFCNTLSFLLPAYIFCNTSTRNCQRARRDHQHLG